MSINFKFSQTFIKDISDDYLNKEITVSGWIQIIRKQNPLIFINLNDGSTVNNLQVVLTEKTEATVPLVFEGEAPAVKDLDGTLIKSIQEITVNALPQDLPHEIVVNIEGLATFEDEIQVKDLKVSPQVEIVKEPDETVAKVTPAQKVEEELEKPIEEEGETEEAEATEETKEEESPESKDSNNEEETE